MGITETPLPGVKIIEPMVFGDHRGWFMETYSEDWLKKAGIKIHFVQDNHSFSSSKGTLRGLHLIKKRSTVTTPFGNGE
ncbi:dTDP-4-dehydrorhamnose 3,5-epimerase family protein [Neobacillus drentensis]|uniref:dTDP-4-dehydrorhamnose 3,5-epimerase family protein n=1 Tax=Neobacillus drentensis TaxID=220684 RepID=UPI001F37299F|nr:dTDP-4-dehydrorhamnose 3,5-epimerase family protein [Neobacillus drentensis]ULT56485.1 dTDP-4-dehydrorhamnose 3,5-epimerase family protein [Neobacillus drentensis]